VVRISPALAGTVILISKIYDSITDPFEGILADRTRTKLGRRRPVPAGGHPVGVPVVLLPVLSIYSMESETTRFALVILSYLFFSTVVRS
jgi:oligogalacturonide transporter